MCDILYCIRRSEPQQLTPPRTPLEGTGNTLFFNLRALGSLRLTLGLTLSLWHQLASKSNNHSFCSVGCSLQPNNESLLEVDYDATASTEVAIQARHMPTKRLRCRSCGTELVGPNRRKADGAWDVKEPPRKRPQDQRSAPIDGQPNTR